MRQHNKYLQKVQEELTIFQKYLIDESTVLTPTQLETFEKINAARAMLRNGYNDSQVLTRLKQNEGLQERRSREVLAMAYATFAELRQSKDKEGVKFMYSELFRHAANEALSAGEYGAYAMLLKEAAKIDGAYTSDADVKTDEYKKPTKIVLKVKTVAAAEPARHEPVRTVHDVGHEVLPSE